MENTIFRINWNGTLISIKISDNFYQILLQIVKCIQNKLFQIWKKKLKKSPFHLIFKSLKGKNNFYNISKKN